MKRALKAKMFMIFQSSMLQLVHLRNFRIQFIIPNILSYKYHQYDVKSCSFNILSSLLDASIETVTELSIYKIIKSSLIIVMEGFQK